MSLPDITPTMPGTHWWVQGGYVFNRASRVPILASDGAEVWCWDGQTGDRVTDLLDQFANPITVLTVSGGLIEGAGVPVAVTNPVFSLGQYGPRLGNLPVQMLINAGNALAPTDAQVTTLWNNTGSAFRTAADADLNATYAPALVGGKQPVRKGDLVLNVMDYGAVGDGSNDDTEAIVNAAAAANARRVLTIGGTVWRAGATLLFPAGRTFKLTSLSAPILLSCNVEGAGAALIAPQAYSQAVLLVGHETSGNVLHTADISLPDVTKTAPATTHTAGSVGVRVQNLYHSRVRFGRVSWMETAHHYTGVGIGTSYNTFHPGWVDLCKIGYKIQPDNTGFPTTGGFVNQNNWVGGGISQSADGYSGSTRRSGYRHLLMDATGGNTIHGNTFTGCSFEGDHSEYFMEFKNAAENIFHGSTRFEQGTPGASAFMQAAFDSIAVTGRMGANVGDVVVFMGTTAPGGITFGQPYYISSVIDADTFQISATPGGLHVDITTDSLDGSVKAYRPPTIMFDNTGTFVRDNIIRDYNSYPGPLEVKRIGAAAPAAKAPIVG